MIKTHNALRLLMLPALLALLHIGYALATCCSMFFGRVLRYPSQLTFARHFRCERKSWLAIVNSYAIRQQKGAVEVVFDNVGETYCANQRIFTGK